MAKTTRRKKLKAEDQEVKAEVIAPTYKGKVIVNGFSIKGEAYKIGDVYSTTSKFNYDTLIKQKRIK